jgi:hypothetical protein
MLDLVHEGATEVFAADLGHAHSSLLAHAVNSLSEGFLIRHRKDLLYR